MWPGLSRLWYHGDLKALGLAIGFATLLNLMVLVSFVRPESVWNSWCGYGWAALVAFWVFGVWQAARSPIAGQRLDPPRDQQDLFIQAQAEYLRGHWVEAQALLEQVIRQNPLDVESRLLLSSVLRRSRRIELSRRQLRRLRELEEAASWRFEIERELAQLDQASERVA